VNRIFLTLAWFALAMMAATLIVGLTIEDLHTDHSPDMLRWATVHRLMGIATALAVVLVNSIVVTYFIGTSRWCKEVCETYALESDLISRSTMLKRRTFPWAVTGMLAVVGVIALGGALAGFCFTGLVFLVEWNRIEANRLVIADVLERVREVRMARGLEV